MFKTPYWLINDKVFDKAFLNIKNVVGHNLMQYSCDEILFYLLFICELRHNYKYFYFIHSGPRDGSQFSQKSLR